MTNLEDMSRHELLSHLPPPDAAPIVGKLGNSGLRAFRRNYAIETPVDERGVVDYDQLMDDVLAFVDPEYRWKAPFFDAHHIQWTAEIYHPHWHNDSPIPNRFRELAINKMWTPRQLHNFIHLITLCPRPPSMEVMQQDIQDFSSIHLMYEWAKKAHAMTIERDQLRPLPDGRVLTRKGNSWRTISPDQYEEAIKELIGNLEDRFSEGGIPARFTKLTTVKFDRITSIEESLPKIRRGLGDIVMKTGSQRRNARVVHVPVERAA